MDKNMGGTDSLLRISIAAVLVILFAFKIIAGILALILLVVAAIFVITSLIGVCPLYRPFRINTRKKQNS